MKCKIKQYISIDKNQQYNLLEVIRRGNLDEKLLQSVSLIFLPQFFEIHIVSRITAVKLTYFVISFVIILFLCRKKTVNINYFNVLFSIWLSNNLNKSSTWFIFFDSIKYENREYLKSINIYLFNSRRVSICFHYFVCPGSRVRK